MRALPLRATAGALAAAACAATIIAAASGAFIAEGRVAAMLVAPGFLLVCVIAAAAGAGLRKLGVRSVQLRHLCALLLLVIGTWLVAWRLPVVQFIEPARVDALYPVHGAWYAFLAGVAGALVARAARWRWRLLAAMASLLSAGYLGHAAQGWFGVAITALGVCATLSVPATRNEESDLPIEGKHSV